MKRLIPVFPLVALIAAVSLLPACGTSEPTVPTGPPIINSFTVEDNTIEPGEAPKFMFDVANASDITIRQDGEVVLNLETTGIEGASRQPLGNVAYALPADGAKPEYHYTAGVFPANFTGASTGKPADCVWKWDNEEQHEVTAELEVRSPDCQVARSSVIILIVRTRRSVESLMVPAHATEMKPSVNQLKELAAPTGPPIINSFTVEDETIGPGEAPKFSFEVANASSITIRQDGEVVFWIEATGTEGASLKPQGNVAYALPADGTEPEYHYTAGIYPVIYKGNTNGKSAYLGVWKPDEGPQEVTAEMEVRSWDGQVATREVEITYMPPEAGETATGEPAAGQGRINEFTIKNAEGIVGEPVEFVIDVSNPAVITIDRDSSAGASFQKGVTIFRQEFTSAAGCPVDFKSTWTGPAPTERGKAIWYRLTVTDWSGQTVYEDRHLEVCIQ